MNNKDVFTNTVSYMFRTFNKLDLYNSTEDYGFFHIDIELAWIDYITNKDKPHDK